MALTLFASLLGAVDILKGIETENINTRQSKLFRDGSMFGNSRLSAPNAMTYLLFPQHFPSEFSILVTFKAALYLPRYVFSLYDANNRMLMGLKLGPGVITFHFGDQNDVSHDRSSHSFAADFKADEWRQIGVSVTSSQLQLTENCVSIGKAPLKGPKPETFDIFGAIYVGADMNEGASKNFLVSSLHSSSIEVCIFPMLNTEQLNQTLCPNQRELFKRLSLSHTAFSYVPGFLPAICFRSKSVDPLSRSISKKKKFLFGKKLDYITMSAALCCFGPATVYCTGGSLMGSEPV